MLPSIHLRSENLTSNHKPDRASKCSMLAHFSLSECSVPKYFSIHSFMVLLTSCDVLAISFSKKMEPSCALHTIIPEPILLNMSLSTSYEAISEFLVTFFCAILCMTLDTKLIKLISISSGLISFCVSNIAKYISIPSLIYIGIVTLVFIPNSFICCLILSSSVSSVWIHILISSAIRRNLSYAIPSISTSSASSLLHSAIFIRLLCSSLI